MNESPLQIKCPHCGNVFSPEAAIEHTIREREKEAEQRMKQQLKSLQEKELRLKELERGVVSRNESIDLEVRKKVMDEEDRIRKEVELNAEKKALLKIKEEQRKLDAEKSAIDQTVNTRMVEREDRIRSEERMGRAQLELKLAEQAKMIEQMNRKLHQGSMQAQGEVQELAIEECLTSLFPNDQIAEVSKGKRGADCIHTVRDTYGNECGRIVYESKRTKHFGNDWIPKLKEDMRLHNAEIGIIVTEALPEGMIRFGERDGVWICTFAELKAVASVFRSQLLRLGELTASQVNRGEKMSMIYAYVTSLEFRQKLEAAFESYADMQHDLAREKALYAQQWSKREKSIEKAMENLISLYGDVRGIAGGAVQEIKALEMPNLEDLLKEG